MPLPGHKITASRPTLRLSGIPSGCSHAVRRFAPFFHIPVESSHHVKKARLGNGRSAMNLKATTSQATQQGDFLTYFDNLEIRTVPLNTEAEVQATLEADSFIKSVLDAHERYETMVVLDDGDRIASAWICFDEGEDDCALVSYTARGLSNDLGMFLLQSAEALARENGIKTLVMSSDAEGSVVWNDPEQLGFCREDDGLFTKDIKPLLGAEDGRAGEKGSSELLTVVSMQNQPIAVYPRRTVEEHNLLHPAIGVLVHNSKGEIYVHQRSPEKSMHGSFYDMFVGGLVLAAEAVPDAARNEVKEELGIEGKELEELFEVVWLASTNRVVLRVFRVEAEDADVSYNDGEVVWGKFMPLAELEAMMAKESFVPGGKKAWEETVKRDLHTKYLK